jgi:hypothetical protein
MKTKTKMDLRGGQERARKSESQTVRQSIRKNRGGGVDKFTRGGPR